MQDAQETCICPEKEQLIMKRLFGQRKFTSKVNLFRQYPRNLDGIGFA